MAGVTLSEKVNEVWAMIQEGSRNPIVQRVAGGVITKAVLGGERNYLTEWGRLHDWCRNHIDYFPQEGERDRFQKAEETLQLGQGDCEDFTILLGAMAQHFGLPYKIRVLSPDRVRWRHVYIMGGYPPGSPTHWVAADPSAQSQPLGWQNRLKYRYWKDFGIRTYPL